MSAKEIRINELRVRTSGLTPEQSRRLGQLVASQLAATPLALKRSRTIPALTIEINQTGSSVDHLANQIANKIRDRLASSK
jgi:hypothetical protein